MERINRWMYRGGKPNTLARGLNRASAWLYSRDSTPEMLDVLETTGRKSGNPVTMPIVVVHLEDERYLVSMLGDDVNWVKNVRAANGGAALLKGERTDVKLEEIPEDDRAPILKRYCEIAPGGRSHIPVDLNAPLADFATIARDYPVFRIVGSQP